MNYICSLSGSVISSVTTDTRTKKERWQHKNSNIVDGEVKKNSYNGFLNADWHGHLTQSGYNDQISDCGMTMVQLSMCTMRSHC